MADLEFSKHAFLAELGLEAENFGVFNGDNWVGSGPVITSYNPTTGAPLARVKGVRDKSSSSMRTMLVRLQTSCSD